MAPSFYNPSSRGREGPLNPGIQVEWTSSLYVLKYPLHLFQIKWVGGSFGTIKMPISTKFAWNHSAQRHQLLFSCLLLNPRLEAVCLAQAPSKYEDLSSKKYSVVKTSVFCRQNFCSVVKFGDRSIIKLNSPLTKFVFCRQNQNKT